MEIIGALFAQLYKAQLKIAFCPAQEEGKNNDHQIWVEDPSPHLHTEHIAKIGKWKAVMSSVLFQEPGSQECFSVSGLFCDVSHTPSPLPNVVVHQKFVLLCVFGLQCA